MKVMPATDVPAEAVAMDGAVGVTCRWLIRDTDGAPNFAMRQFEVAPGGCTPHHTHAFEHEVYFLAGRGILAADDGDKPLAAGTFTSRRDGIINGPRRSRQYRAMTFAEVQS